MTFERSSPTGMPAQPATSDLLYGAVVRPPRYRLRDGRFECARLMAVDERSLQDMAGIVSVVVRGNFVGVVAAQADIARRAAARLIVTWQDIAFDDDIPEMAEQASPALAETFSWRYGWPNRLRWGHAPGWIIAHRDDDVLDVWTQSATPELLRGDLVALSGLAAENVHVFAHDGADGLGRHCSDDATADAALLSCATRRPVAVWLGPDYASEIEALGLAQRMEATAIGSGTRIASFDYRLHQASNVAPAVALLLAGVPAHSPGHGAGEGGGGTAPYTFEHQMTSYPAPGDQAYRDANAARLQDNFAQESFFDEAAGALGVDPVELRLRHLDDERDRALIESVARQANWSPATAKGAHPHPVPGDIRHGRGFAYYHLSDVRNIGDGAEQGKQDSGVRSAWIADIEVNQVTGEVHLARLVVGQDSGPALDQEALRAELQRQLLPNTSSLLTVRGGFDEWSRHDDASPAGTKRQPVVESVPAISASRLSTTGEPHPIVAKATFDDVVLIPGTAAIANALFDATGLRFREPPFTPERVRAAMAEDNSLFGNGSRKKGRGRLVTAAMVTGVGVIAALWPWKSPIAPIARPAANLYSAQTIERGRLVAEVGDCAVCHTAENGEVNAGGRAFETPFGTLYSTNITPDEETGIGRWSYAAFERAMRHGISRDGRHLYPAFPYTAFAKIGDADMQALYGYLMAQPVTAVEAPDNALSFPFSYRPLMAGWNALFHDPAPFKPDPTQSAQWNRGAYLAEGAGHCSACHSPRNAMGAERGGEQYFAGAVVDGWEAPPLNTLSKSPIPWTEASLYDYLRTGTSTLHGMAAGPMAPVVAGLAELPKEDVRAIATYVASFINPRAEPELDTAELAEPLKKRASTAPSGMEAGDRLFNGACASCHDSGAIPTFSAAKTSLALNTSLHSNRPNNLIQSILGGIHTSVDGMGGEMPGFQDSLNDSQVTTLVGYLRARFAPEQKAWENVKETVKEIRKEKDNHRNA